MSHMDLHRGIIYGPITSRRLGRSLGVNLLPPSEKVCSFNCLYCQYGWTDARPRSAPPPVGWPPATAVADAVARALADPSSPGSTLDRITLAGHGEPTLHPDFGGVVAALRHVRDAVAPGVALAILSNSTTAHEPHVRDALLQLDERYMKLDAGDRDTLRRMNASAAPLGRLIDALAALPGVMLQAMFVDDDTGRATNTTPAAIDAWLEAVARIRPAGVHIYSVDRQPAWPHLQPASRTLLDEIARRTIALGVEARVFT
jgi:wyosine [tRNA(Phe)-imidazoG37] synthetase (radical SAM superfamily)